jgi:hypothetical protein
MNDNNGFAESILSIMKEFVYQIFNLRDLRNLLTFSKELFA